jgi:hypothetical protein
VLFFIDAIPIQQMRQLSLGSLLEPFRNPLQRHRRLGRNRCVMNTLSADILIECVANSAP